MQTQTTVQESLTVRVNPSLSVVIHAAEGGGYWAEVPAFAGAVYAEGETAEDARRNVEAALAEYFARRERRRTELDAATEPLVDDQGVIPAIPARADDLGVMMPIPGKVEAARRAAAARSRAALDQLPDDPPGAWEGAMEGLDSHRPEGQKLFEGMY